MDTHARDFPDRLPLAVPKFRFRAPPSAAGRATSAWRSVPLVALVLCLLCLLCQASSAEEPIEKRMDVLFGEHERYLAFFQELKGSVVRGDKRAIAGLLHYPLDVFDGRRRTVVRSPAQFRKRYHEIFNENVIQAVKSQEPDALFANWQGVKVGSGQVWFSGICAGKDQDKPCASMAIKVITVNTKAPGT